MTYFDPFKFSWGPSWSWTYGGWIYLTLWFRMPLRRDILDTTFSQWLVAGWWLSLWNPVSSTNKTDRHDITEILLKVVLTTITLTPSQSSSIYISFQIHIFQDVDNNFSYWQSFALHTIVREKTNMYKIFQHLYLNNFSLSENMFFSFSVVCSKLLFVFQNNK